MTEERFVAIPHTADKAITAYGATLEELFENAAYGMFSLMADLERHEASDIREISVEAEDLESLLRGWLSECLFQFEVDRVLFVEFSVSRVGDCSVEGTAGVAPFDGRVEWLGSIVKAVTYHELGIHQSHGRWEATIVFDV